MSALNKRSFLKFLGLTFGSLATSSIFKSSKNVEASSEQVKLVYRIEFPKPLSETEFKELASQFFDRPKYRKIMAEINCLDRLKPEVVRTSNYYQKTLTFPSQKELQLYLKSVSNRKEVINHDLLLDAGYKAYFKVIS